MLVFCFHIIAASVNYHWDSNINKQNKVTRIFCIQSDNQNSEHNYCELNNPLDNLEIQETPSNNFILSNQLKNQLETGSFLDDNYTSQGDSIRNVILDGDCPIQNSEKAALLYDMDMSMIFNESFSVSNIYFDDKKLYSSPENKNDLEGDEVDNKHIDVISIQNIKNDTLVKQLSYDNTKTNETAVSSTVNFNYDINIPNLHLKTKKCIQTNLKNMCSGRSCGFASIKKQPIKCKQDLFNINNTSKDLIKLSPCFNNTKLYSIMPQTAEIIEKPEDTAYEGTVDDYSKNNNFANWYKLNEINIQSLIKFINDCILILEQNQDILIHEINLSLSMSNLQKKFLFNFFYDDKLKIKKEFIILLLLIPEINTLTVLYENMKQHQKISPYIAAILQNHIHNLRKEFLLVINNYKYLLNYLAKCLDLIQGKPNLNFIFIFFMNNSNFSYTIYCFRLELAKILILIYPKNPCVINYKQLISNGFENSNYIENNASYGAIFTFFLNGKFIKNFITKVQSFKAIVYILNKKPFDYLYGYISKDYRIYAIINNLKKYFRILTEKYDIDENMLLSDLKVKIQKSDKISGLVFYKNNMNETVDLYSMFSVQKGLNIIYYKYAELLLLSYIND